LRPMPQPEWGGQDPRSYFNAERDLQEAGWNPEQVDQLMNARGRDLPRELREARRGMSEEARLGARVRGKRNVMNDRMRELYEAGGGLPPRDLYEQGFDRSQMQQILNARGRDLPRELREARRSLPPWMRQRANRAGRAKAALDIARDEFTRAQGRQAWNRHLPEMPRGTGRAAEATRLGGGIGGPRGVERDRQQRMLDMSYNNYLMGTGRGE